MKSSKNYYFTCFLLLIFCSLSLAVPPDIHSAGLEEPGDIIIKGKKPADFDHKKHRLAGISCDKCHHDADHQPQTAEDIKKLSDKAMLACLGCHKDEKFENRDKPLPQEVFHGLCRECHLSIIDAKKGPTKCGGCHAVDGMEEEKKEAASPLEEEYSEENSNLCLACHNHQEKYDNGMQLEYLHRPFAEKQCRKCHIPASQDDDNGIVTFGTKEEEKDKKEKAKTKIRWLARDYTPSETHWFVVPADNIDKGIVIVGGSNANQKNTFQADYSLPQLNKLKELKNDETPPQISDVKILAVTHGIATSTTIGWTTNELSNSLIKYGVEDQQLTTSLDVQMLKEHKATITNLQPNQTYQFSVISRDIFGNEQISETFTLSTEKAFSDIVAPTEQNIEKDKTTLLKKEFFRHNDNYLVEITTNKPMTIFLGTRVPIKQDKAKERRRKARNKEINDNGDMDLRRKAKPEIPDAHWVLRTKAETGIDLCVSCHLNFLELTMHPVGIMPSKNIVLPEEYPALPDGEIACLSCHDPHASPYRKLLRRESKKEVCLGCHQDKTGRLPGE